MNYECETWKCGIGKCDTKMQHNDAELENVALKMLVKEMYGKAKRHKYPAGMIMNTFIRY